MQSEDANRLAPTGNSIKLDPNVCKELPTDCQVVSFKTHGESFWAKTGRIDVSLRCGTTKAFFIKILSHEDGGNMVRSEFESMKAISLVVPDFVPKPIACGPFVSAPDTYFFLCEFRDMSGQMPDKDDFAPLLATLHNKSISPNGSFGFHVTTYAGNLAQWVGWEESWEVFFTKSMRQALDFEIEKQGPSVELDILSEALFTKVIPRLLRPLESSGRKVKPSLVHGDLWYANSGVDSHTGKPLVFDACCFYAHHEYELGQWMPPCNKFDSSYVDAYKIHSEPSEPKEDFEGRLDLYRLRFDTHVSALFGQENLRIQVLDVMGDLVRRYA